MKIEKMTPIIVNEKVIGFVNDNCDKNDAGVPAIIFPMFFDNHYLRDKKGYETEHILALSATFEAPEDEKF